MSMLSGMIELVIVLVFWLLLGSLLLAPVCIIGGAIVS